MKYRQILNPFLPSIFSLQFIFALVQIIDLFNITTSTTIHGVTQRIQFSLGFSLLVPLAFLCLIWIICWAAAIWAYHIQFFLTGLFCLFLAIVLLGYFDKKEESKIPKPPVVFSMDKNTKTLTVQKIYESGLKWTDNEVCSGNAVLPSGVIKEGDVVTKCDGNVALRHVPSNTLIGGFDFKKSK